MKPPRRRTAIAMTAGWLAAASLTLVACHRMLDPLGIGEARRRAKIAMTASDLRVLSIACEAYGVDWNAYPPHAAGPGSVNGPIGGQAALLPTFTPALTTPVAYISSMPKDFLSANGEATYLYWAVNPPKGSEDRRGFIVVSAGPDGVYDVAADWKSIDPGNKQSIERLTGGANAAGSAFTYDPTNGTASRGDIWVSRPWGTW